MITEKASEGCRLLALRTEKGTTSQGMQVALEAGKEHEGHEFFLDSLDCPHLDVNPVRPTCDPCKILPSVLFQAIKSVVMFYCSLGKEQSLAALTLWLCHSALPELQCLHQ